MSKSTYTKTPEYIAYMNMIHRCYNVDRPGYENYGGRGIKVALKWLVSFENFLADMGIRPEGHSIDRIDNNKGYEPGNCRWATREEQNKNRRIRTVNTFEKNLITIDGETKFLSHWCRELGISHTTIWNRVRKHNITIKEALSYKPNEKGKSKPSRPVKKDFIKTIRENALIKWNLQTPA